MTRAQSHVHYRTCHLCEAMCGIAISAHEGEVTSIKGDSEDPFSRGHICPKAAALADLQNDPDRLKKPLLRDGNCWREIPWEEAFNRAAGALAQIHKRDGADAIAVYAGNPNVHNYGLLTHGSRFLGQIGTKNRFSASSVDQMPHQLVTLLMYGHQLLVPVPDLDHCHTMLILGANPLASNGSMMSVPDVRRRLSQIRKRGGKLVVVDPRKTETAKVADEHHFIRPGTDAAFLAALLHSLFHENLVRPGRLAPLTEGFESLEKAVAAFTPERAAQITGIDAATTRRLARELAHSPAAVCYGRMGVCTQRYGTLCQWFIQLINIATGNLDRRGGSMFTLPAIDLPGGPKSKPGHFNQWQSRVRGLPEFGGELPAATMAEEMTTPGPGRIRALVTVAGNPVLSTPNGPQLEKALTGLEFVLALDFYINETTRHAHLILPPTGPLEHDHFDLIFNVLAIRNTVKYSPALWPKPEGAYHDWEILEKLGEQFSREMGRQARKGPTPTQYLDLGLRHGPYGSETGHPLALSLDKLREHPHGMDLGPLQPCLPGRLKTATGKIQAAPAVLMEGLAALESQLFAAEQPSGLTLIGRRHLRSNNSWMHNLDRLVRGKNLCVLLMNPKDMEARSLLDGQKVRVTTRTGTVEAPVEATEDMMAGVVSLPHGWGHHRNGTRIRIAEGRPGVSANDLTDDRLLDQLSGNAAINGIPVSVTAC